VDPVPDPLLFRKSVSTGNRTREDNIKVNLKEIGYKVRVWIHLAENRIQWRTLVNTVINYWIPQARTRGGGESFTLACFSASTETCSTRS
jgi:hypothetical protein